MTDEDRRRREQADHALREKDDRAFDRLPVNPPEGQAPTKDKSFYCIICDSAYCTCIKEKP